MLAFTETLPLFPLLPPQVVRVTRVVGDDLAYFSTLSGAPFGNSPHGGVRYASVRLASPEGLRTLEGRTFADIRLYPGREGQVQDNGAGQAVLVLDPTQRPSWSQERRWRWWAWFQ